MPKPGDGEKEKDFIKRCIPIVIDEGTAGDNKEATAICHSMWRKAKGVKAEMIDLVSLEGVGPTILGAAVTNRPFIKGLPSISFKEDGTMIVPLLKEGVYKHKTAGTLKFNREVFRKMIENFDNNVLGIDISLDNRHKPEIGANGWFKQVFIDSNGLLCAEVEPTPPGKESIENKQYRYASIEFHRDWESPELRFSGEDLVEITETEDDMPESVVTLEQYQELEQARLELQQQLEKSVERVARLEEAHGRTVVALEAQLLREKVASIVAQAEAYRGEDGKGHPKMLIDWARHTLLLEDIGEGEDVVELEDSSKASKVLAYFRKAIKVLLETLPGTVPFETKAPTERSTERSVELSNKEMSDDELTEYVRKEFWEVEVTGDEDAN